MRPGAGRGIGAGVKRKGNGRRYAGCMPMAWVHRTETVREDGDVWDVDRPIRYLSVTRLQIKEVWHWNSRALQVGYSR